MLQAYTASPADGKENFSHTSRRIQWPLRLEIPLKGRHVGSTSIIPALLRHNLSPPRSRPQWRSAAADASAWDGDSRSGMRLIAGSGATKTAQPCCAPASKSGSRRAGRPIGAIPAIPACRRISISAIRKCEIGRRCCGRRRSASPTPRAPPSATRTASCFRCAIDAEGSRASRSRLRAEARLRDLREAVHAGAGTRPSLSIKAGGAADAGDRRRRSDGAEAARARRRRPHSRSRP